MRFDKKYWRVQYKLANKKIQQIPNLPHILVGATLFSIVFALMIIDIQYYGGSQVSTFTNWQAAQTKHQSRLPASSSNICQDSNFIDINKLKNDISKLEAKYETGSHLNGKVFGVELKKLPSIGAQLLADHKDLIGDRKKIYKFESCSSVPCILNKIYNDESELLGHLTYFWYLKTGSMLSMTNFIPEQNDISAGKYNGSEFRFSDYLFNKNELLNFYHLAQSLPDTLTFLPLMKSIHKVPGNQGIEDLSFNQCSIALPYGQVLLAQNCLNKNKKDFFVNTTIEISKYIDRQKGLQQGLSHLSLSEEWLKIGGWTKENYLDPVTHSFNYRWKTNLTKNQIISQRASQSPSEHLSSLIAYYRFMPKEFQAKTPMDIRAWIRHNIFNDQTFDPDGLYKQCIKISIDDWSRQEASLWKDCLGNHLVKDDISKLQKDLVKTLDHPLYTCVQKKIPGFIEYERALLKKEQFEGCAFFNDQQKYGHVADKFDESLTKYLYEKTLQRKIEIQKHGQDVLSGQVVKNEFFSKVDPKSIYIQCFDKENEKTCYEARLKGKLHKMMSFYPEITDYYKGVIAEDIVAIYPFEYVKSKSTDAAKKFLAPFSAHLNLSAYNMWDECKSKGMDQDEKLNLPLKFSGGRHFVDSQLINCINANLEEELDNLTEIKAFQKIDGKQKVFRLNSQEQKFALSFLEGKLLQTLSIILDEEFLVEKMNILQHYEVAQNEAFKKLQEDKELFNDLYSFSQFKDLCIENIVSFYPKNYFYHSKTFMDQNFGNKLCEQFVNQPSVKSKVQDIVQQKWNKSKNYAEEFLAEEFEDLVDDCNDDYPIDGSQYGSNSRYRKLCIEDAAGEALFLALKEWKDEDDYEYFYNRENELLSHFRQILQSKFIGRAVAGEPIIEE